MAILCLLPSSYAGALGTKGSVMKTYFRKNIKAIFKSEQFKSMRTSAMALFVVSAIIFPFAGFVAYACGNRGVFAKVGVWTFTAELGVLIACGLHALIFTDLEEDELEEL